MIWGKSSLKKKKMKQYIRESSREAKKRQEHYTIFGDIDVFIKDALPDNIDVRTVLSDIQATIPTPFSKNLDIIYIGDFDHLNDRDIDAVYDSGAIYLTNNQDDNQDMIDDIVHEISHLVEENHSNDIYGDDAIEMEFIAKRIALKRILESHGYNMSFYNFTNLDFSHDLDHFFYDTVGYPKLNKFVMGLLVSSYAATSLREYFASGFEEYYLGDRRTLLQVSPKLYDKIDQLNQRETEYERNKL